MLHSCYIQVFPGQDGGCRVVTAAPPRPSLPEVPAATVGAARSSAGVVEALPLGPGAVRPSLGQVAGINAKPFDYDYVHLC
jgi:hypothetical protein